MNRIQQILEKAERDETVRGCRSGRSPSRKRQRRRMALPSATSRAKRPEAVEEPLQLPWAVTRETSPSTGRTACAGLGLRFRPQRIASLDRGAAEPAPRCRLAAGVAGRRTIPFAAQPHQPRPERSGDAGDSDHQPRRPRRQDGDCAQPRVDDGAGIPAPGADRRYRPAAARGPRDARTSSWSRARRRADW